MSVRQIAKQTANIGRLPSLICIPTHSQSIPHSRFIHSSQRYFTVIPTAAVIEATPPSTAKVLSLNRRMALAKVDRKKVKFQKRQDAVKLAQQNLRKAENGYQSLLRNERKLQTKHKRKLKTTFEKETELLKAFPDPNLPKKPATTGYALFFKEYLSNSNQSWENNRNSMKESAAKWRAMSDSEKAPFVEKVAVMRAEYNRLKTKYDGSDSRQKWLIIAQQLKDSKPSPNGSGFTVFFRRNFSKSYHSSDSESAPNVLKALGAQYRRLSEEEKDVFKMEGKKELLQWKEKVASYYND